MSFIDFAELAFRVIKHHQPGHPGGAWTSEEVDIVRRKVLLFSFLQIRDILFGPFKWKLVKRCWSCWTRRTTTGSTQKEFLYRREHSQNGRCWIIQVLNYSQKYLGAELFSELFRCWIILRNILKPVWSRFNTSPLLDSVWKPFNSVELIQYLINLLVFQN